jgi:hypothetical protein
MRETFLSRIVLRPYLVQKGEDGIVRITVRTTRFNSQGYPLVDSRILEEEFPTVARARLHLRSEFRAETDEIATK